MQFNVGKDEKGGDTTRASQEARKERKKEGDEQEKGWLAAPGRGEARLCRGLRRHICVCAEGEGLEDALAEAVEQQVRGQVQHEVAAEPQVGQEHERRAVVQRMQKAELDVLPEGVARVDVHVHHAVVVARAAVLLGVRVAREPRARARRQAGRQAVARVGATNEERLWKNKVNVGRKKGIGGIQRA